MSILLGYSGPGAAAAAGRRQAIGRRRVALDSSGAITGPWATGARIWAMQRTFPITAMLILALNAPVLAGDKVYRWVNEEGTVMFSDTPPPGREAEEINLPDLPTNTLETPARERRELLRQSEQIERKIERRQATRAALQQELTETREALQQARQALAQNREPRPDERRALAGGGTRLLPSYFDRIERQEAEIERLEQRINELEQSLGALR